MNWKGTKTLVTGAGGFIGSQLVERLLELGANVFAFVRYNSQNNPGFLDLLGPKKQDVRLIFGDIRDPQAVRTALHGMDAVFHLAALIGVPYSFVHPVEVFEVNANGTLNILVAAREANVARVMITSTSEVYGTANYVPIDERHPKQPHSPYAASKVSADAIALSFHASFQVPVAIVRPFNTYGPRQSDRAIIPAIIIQALTKDEIRLGNTAPTRDFTFVTDTVDGMIAAGGNNAAIGQEINLGTGQEISIGELAARINTIVGRDLPVRRADERMRPNTSEVMRLLSDNSKARALTGWTPAVSLDTGLARTVEWVRGRLAMYDANSYRI